MPLLASIISRLTYLVRHAGATGVLGSALVGEYRTAFNSTPQEDFSKVAGPGTYTLQSILSLCPEVAVTPMQNDECLVSLTSGASSVSTQSIAAAGTLEHKQEQEQEQQQNDSLSLSVPSTPTPVSASVPTPVSGPSPSPDPASVNSSASVTAGMIVRRLTLLVSLAPDGAIGLTELGQLYRSTFDDGLKTDCIAAGLSGSLRGVLALYPQFSVTALQPHSGQYHVSLNGGSFLSTMDSKSSSDTVASPPMSAPTPTPTPTTTAPTTTSVKVPTPNNTNVTRDRIIRRLTDLVNLLSQKDGVGPGRGCVSGTVLVDAYLSTYKSVLYDDFVKIAGPGKHQLHSIVAMCPELSMTRLAGPDGDFSVSFSPMPNSGVVRPPKPSHTQPPSYSVSANMPHNVLTRADILNRLTAVVANAGQHTIAGSAVAELYRVAFNTTLRGDCLLVGMFPKLRHIISMCPQLTATLPNATGQFFVSMKTRSYVPSMEFATKNGGSSTRTTTTTTTTAASKTKTAKALLIRRLTFLVSREGRHGLTSSALGGKLYASTFNSSLKLDCAEAGIEPKLKTALAMCPELVTTQVSASEYHVSLRKASSVPRMDSKSNRVLSTLVGSRTAMPSSNDRMLDVSTLTKRLIWLVSKAGQSGLIGSALGIQYRDTYSRSFKDDCLEAGARDGMRRVVEMCPQLELRPLPNGLYMVALKRTSAPSKPVLPHTAAGQQHTQTNVAPTVAVHADAKDSLVAAESDPAAAPVTMAVPAAATVSPVKSQPDDDSDSATDDSSSDSEYDSTSEDSEQEEDDEENVADQPVLYLTFDEQHQPVYSAEPPQISSDDLKHRTQESAALAARNNTDIDRFLEILPPAIANAVRPLMASNAASSSLIQVMDVLVDFDRTPSARLSMPARDGARAQQCITLGNERAGHEDLNFILDKLGNNAFDDKNRAGVEHTLHRISVIPNRLGRPIGFTMRVGRTAASTLGLADDLLHSDRSILLLGPPGVGKTTALREFARVLSAQREVVIVDTSGEIAGEGDSIHPSVGRSRRLLVPDTKQQHDIMNQAVQNHTPDTVIIDEIGTAREARAAYSIAKRGIQLIGSAHGTSLRDLFEDPELMSLCGGAQSVILGDSRMRELNMHQKTMMERKKAPAFHIAIEIVSPAQWVLHPNLTETIDRFLQGKAVQCEVRTLVVGENDNVHIESQMKQFNMSS
jgi:stage III sporulation protein SpoIIIAA